jgi:hypothetical protein
METETMMRALIVLTLALAAGAAQADIRFMKNQEAYVANFTHTVVDSYDDLPAYTAPVLQRSFEGLGYEVTNGYPNYELASLPGATPGDRYLWSHYAHAGLYYENFSGPVYGFGGTFLQYYGGGTGNSLVITAADTSGKEFSVYTSMESRSDFFGLVSDLPLLYVYFSPNRDSHLAANDVHLSAGLVPEPSSLAMLAAGVLLLGGTVRRAQAGK